MREVQGRSRPWLAGRPTVVASNDRVLITGLVHFFDSSGPLVGAATTETEALHCLNKGSADLLVCSAELDQGGNGSSLVAKAKAAYPKLKCLMLIRRPLLSTIQAAIGAGCDGLCSHERIGKGGLLSVLQAMDSDGSHLDPLVTGVLQHHHNQRSGSSPLTDRLSIREEDVLHGLCRGLSNAEIADQRQLSVDTIKHVVSSLLRKLEARDRTQAVLTAFQRDLVSPPAPIPRWKS